MINVFILFCRVLALFISYFISIVNGYKCRQWSRLSLWLDIKVKNLKTIHFYAPKNIFWEQFDQIGLLLEGFGKKYSSKSSQTIYLLLGKMLSLFCKAPRLLPRTVIMLSFLLSYVARMYPFAYPIVLDNMTVWK